MIQDKEKVLDKLFNEFLNKDLKIILAGTIETQFIIHNAKIVMNNKHLIITNCEDEEVIISLDELSDVKISEYYITFEINNQMVTIDN